MYVFIQNVHLLISIPGKQVCQYKIIKTPAQRMGTGP